MRHSPFLLALVVGVSTTAFTAFSGVALAQEADSATEADEQAAAEEQADANESANEASSEDAPNESANAEASADSAANDSQANANQQESADQQTTTEQQSAPDQQADPNLQPDAPPPPDASQDPAVDANLNNRGQSQSEGNIHAQAPTSGQPQLPLQGGLSTQTDSQQQLDANQQFDANQNQAQLDTRQQGRFETNNQLSAESINQHLGIQFDQTQTSRVAGQQGLSITTIEPNSVFYTSGFRRGDVLLSIDNRPIASRADFVRLITTYEQDRIPLVVLRNGQRQTIYFTRPADLVVHDHPSDPSSQAMLGVTFDPKMGGAAVVRAVTPRSPAEKAGIMIGDVITALNGQPVLAAHEVVSMIGAMQPGQQVTVTVSRNQYRLRTAATLAAREEVLRHTVGYAPEVSARPLPAPVGPPVIREDTTYRVQPRIQPARPGDPDGDGRFLDGDGRIPRRALDNRR